MQRRRPQDAIAPHAQRLVQYMNTHPDTLLAYARYFGNYEAPASARMTDVDADGIVLAVTRTDGVEEDLHVKFRARLRGSEEVRPMLEEMAQEAEEALGLPSTRPPGPRASKTSGVHTPYLTPNPKLALPLAALTVLLLTITYYPSPPPLLIQKARDYFGFNFLYGCVYFTIFMHTSEAIGVVAVLMWRGEPDPMTMCLWVGGTLLLGIGGFSGMLGDSKRRDASMRDGDGKER